jgi:microsomal dipeptidase-like Zn-dependent dipeptidase
MCPMQPSPSPLSLPVCDLHCDTVLELQGWASLAGNPAGHIETLADHVEHMVRVMGDDHVAFGSDFDGVGQLPRGVPDCSAFPRILERFAARGLSERSLRKIAWDNFLRVLLENE